MNLTDIRKAAPKRKKKWIVGRGESSGSGKTSGRGHKGQKARTGVSFRPYFEGGQMPLIRRIPKRGFNNNQFKKQYALVNLTDLNTFNDGEVVDVAKLKSTGIIDKELDGVKVLADGELNKKITIKAHKFSKNALEKIKKAGSNAEVISAVRIASQDKPDNNKATK